MSTDTGGPAFPCDDASARFPGMSLRDYFAAKALSAMILCALDQSGTREPDLSFRSAAANAYRYADAMLAAREATP